MAHKCYGRRFVELIDRGKRQCARTSQKGFGRRHSEAGHSLERHRRPALSKGARRDRRACRVSLVDPPARRSNQPASAWRRRVVVGVCWRPRDTRLTTKEDSGHALVPEQCVSRAGPTRVRRADSCATRLVPGWTDFPAPNPILESARMLGPQRRARRPFDCDRPAADWSSGVGHEDDILLSGLRAAPRATISSPVAVIYRERKRDYAWSDRGPSYTALS